MYSGLLSIQILISLLKKHGIKDVVLSAGQSNSSFARSIEHDSDFSCYSVVDERSAAFFALGLSLETGKPVAISCTASTACCNYLSAITEACYRGIPIVVLTSNYDIRYVDQLKLLSIHQENMFEHVCKKEVQLPQVQDQNSFTYCARLVNEALLEIDHHGKGPVHIDIPSYGGSLEVTAENLPTTKAIYRHNLYDNWEVFAKKLAACSKVMVVCGQDYYSDIDIKLLKELSNKYGCIIAGEHMSNIQMDEFINFNPIVSNTSHDVLGEYMPQIMITLGKHLQLDWLIFKGYDIEHWSVCEDGKVADCFDALTNIFESNKTHFLQKMLDCKIGNSKYNHMYLNQWKKLSNEIAVPDLSMSHVYAIKLFSEMIPANSILHMSVFNSIRIMQYFRLSPNIKCYANLGALGIDGCLSTFLGQAAVCRTLSFLLIGDLSFFYDMNALNIRHINNNVRILMINNHGGAEFYQNNGWYDTIDLHTAAKHSKSAKGWVTSCGIKYISASNKEEYQKRLKEFVSQDESPIFLEVFSTMKNDAQALSQLRNSNWKQSKKDSIKKQIKNIVGKNMTKKIKKFVNK